MEPRAAVDIAPLPLRAGFILPLQETLTVFVGEPTLVTIVAGGAADTSCNKRYRPSCILQIANSIDRRARASRRRRQKNSRSACGYRRSGTTRIRSCAKEERTRATMSRARVPLDKHLQRKIQKNVLRSVQRVNWSSRCKLD